MDKESNFFLGIDVGGTHVKIGLVKLNGEIPSFYKEETRALRADPRGFNLAFVDIIAKYLQKHQEIDRVGIGLPGLISKDRTTALEIPAIPEMNGFDLKSKLLEKYPDVSFFLENDASAAAVGEYRFGKNKTTGNFIFITLGTGVGSALIMDGHVYKGVRGNAMEMGHMLSRNNTRLEVLIGRNGILNITKKMMKKLPEDLGELANTELGIHLLVASAKNGNKVSLAVFEEVGEILGEAIVSTIRILDVNEIYFGGGISAGLPFIMPSMEKSIHQYLTPYYLSDLSMKRASLENNAGTLGAAALCFMD